MLEGGAVHLDVKPGHRHHGSAAQLPRDRVGWRDVGYVAGVHLKLKKGGLDDDNFGGDFKEIHTKIFLKK